MNKPSGIEGMSITCVVEVKKYKFLLNMRLPRLHIESD
jgi:hypothetical protein